ncbi:MAG TPA: hypothetical protein PKI86_02120, partial [Chitinophagales bacterium]|nr:hypothetical protein [Chitinophagales bacterium]
MILVSQNLKAQNVRLFINKEDASVKIKQKQLFKNEKEAQQYLKTTQQKLILQGYLEASFDSIKQQHDSIFADLHTGRKYTVNNPVVDVSKRKKKKSTPSGNVFEADIAKETLIQNLENNGYPFAKVTSDSIQLNDSSVSFKYDVDKGKLILIDSFINHGTSKLTKGFIQNYVLIKSKQPYNESRIKDIDKLLQKLPYAIVRQPSNILFRDNKADIHLYLDKRKVNSFDFLIGFLPG